MPAERLVSMHENHVVAKMLAIVIIAIFAIGKRPQAIIASRRRSNDMVDPPQCRLSHAKKP